jgi:hypothetical protein
VLLLMIYFGGQEVDLKGKIDQSLVSIGHQHFETNTHLELTFMDLGTTLAKAFSYFSDPQSISHRVHFISGSSGSCLTIACLIVVWNVIRG